MFGMKKSSASGVQLIEEVIGQFTDMIDKLKQGVEDCRSEQCGITEQIQELRQKDAVLDKAAGRAGGLCMQLENMIPTEEEEVED